jgi:hypothetical protein
MFVGFNLISGICSWRGWLVEVGPDFLWFGRVPHRNVLRIITSIYRNIPMERNPG